MSTQKRCYYEVLGLTSACTQEEIRSSYKKLALQRHPDKLIQSGVPQEEATSSFQELVHAYEVLSDPKERSWYDSHKSQILYACNDQVGSDKFNPFPDLFRYFSPSCYSDYGVGETGFYGVYGGVFERVYGSEVGYCRRMGLNVVGVVKEAPLMGDLGSDYSQVSAFYGYWTGFTTVMDFGWVDKWDAGMGVNRKSRRVMEEENKKLRKKARKEYNETVRGLAEFVKKRDKRVVDMMVRKEREREKKRLEELERKKERERERLEMALRYEEPEWARVDEEEVEEFVQEEVEEEEEEKKEFYCVACGKKFKSDKQWKNHEQSKKHKEKVAELRRSFAEEDGFEDVEDDDEIEKDVETKAESETEAESNRDVNDECKDDVGHDDFVSAEDDVEELEEKFRESVGLEEGKSDEELHVDDEVDTEDDVMKGGEPVGVDESVGSDDESSILEAMISGRRNKKRATAKNQPKVSFELNQAQSEEEMEPMEYNKKKGKKKSRRAKKDKGKGFEAETSRAGDGSTNVTSEKDNEFDDLDTANGGADDDQANHATESSSKDGKQNVEKKGTSKKDAEARPRNSTKGRKQKDKSRNTDPVCEKCGEEFESRNKLYKHISETGHASLKSR